MIVPILLSVIILAWALRNVESLQYPPQGVGIFGKFSIDQAIYLFVAAVEITAVWLVTLIVSLVF